MRLFLFFLIITICNQASADFITFSSEVNSGGSPKIVIDNRSSAGWDMIRATFDFSGTPVNLTNPQSLAFGTYGHYSTVNSVGGLNSLNAASITSQKIEWDFSGMQTGDGFGISINLGDVRGPDLNGATIAAVFKNINSGRTEKLNYKYNISGNGKSFPAYATASVPEPTSFGLIAAGAVALVTRRRSRLFN